MKRFLLLAGLFFFFVVVACVIMGNSRWHLERNAHNDQPAGVLTKVKDSLFLDQAQRHWVLLPQSMNTFHQPDDPVAAPPAPYGKAIIGLNEVYDPRNPNLKLLSEDDRGGSFEAILQPDGTYLETGPQLATYNYGHPVGFWGFIRHTMWDVLPHFANGKYRNPVSPATEH